MELKELMATGAGFAGVSNVLSLHQKVQQSTAGLIPDDLAIKGIAEACPRDLLEKMSNLLYVIRSKQDELGLNPPPIETHVGDDKQELH